MPRIETHSIDWACRRCRERGRFPQLDVASSDDVRDAIQRGHERRSPSCHDRHGTRHVVAVQDGKTLRFGA